MATKEKNMPTNTNFVFKPGKLTTLLDGGAGSSGKGKIGSFITANADNWQFACNTFAPQAGHWVRLHDGRQWFYQTLNSCAYNHEKFEKIYLGPGAMIELPALLREMEENGIPRSKIGISPVVPILDVELDQGFERGTLGFDGQLIEKRHEGTSKFGSTNHGVGSCAARRILRRPSVKIARDCEQIKDMVCDVPVEIMSRLNKGQAGLLEIAQGFQLSNQHSYHWPYVTYRNVNVAQGFSDMFLPIKYAGDTIINFRTYPIRINSNKYISTEDGRHLTWAEVQNGAPHTIYEGNSGKWYPDQKELDWETLTKISGAKDPIFEITSVTKLPRRVATFSRMNLDESVMYNEAGTDTHISLNFCNYVDAEMEGSTEKITPKFQAWMDEYLKGVDVRFLGTGACTEDTIIR
jgi:hypothetical protein